MHSRLILKKLILTGDGKQDAVIDFHEGLNVIAGASDTGKSFAFECINFILGSSEVPSCPPEAKGYQTVFIEIKDSCQQEVFTLKRIFQKIIINQFLFAILRTKILDRALLKSCQQHIKQIKVYPKSY